MNDRAIYAVANSLHLPIGDRSIHMIATSPPYWGLRSYDTGDHKDKELGAEPLHDCLAWARGDEPCGACYVCNMRTWGREMWRVLRDDGVMFVNLGDSYAGSGKGQMGNGTPSDRRGAKQATSAGTLSGGLLTSTPPGLKSKDLAGIPWRVALALQADGWYLRSDIIWAKPNPMPESVTDRPTKAHEYVFLLTKRPRYFWDAEAVKEPSIYPDDDRKARSSAADKRTPTAMIAGIRPGSATYPTRNARSVWTVATQPYAGAHFATWPPALVERMVKAGTSERGVCPECGAPWKRVVEKSEPVNAPRNPNDVRPYDAGSGYNNGNGATTLHKVRTVTTVDWRPTCGHDATPVPAVALDPFAGSGTTLMVARRLGRIGLGFDLSYAYLYESARARLGHDALATWREGGGVRDNRTHEDLPLFSLLP